MSAVQLYARFNYIITLTDYTRTVRQFSFECLAYVLQMAKSPDEISLSRTRVVFNLIGVAIIVVGLQQVVSFLEPAILFQLK